MARFSFSEKLDRAYQHLDALEVEIDRWLGTHPQSETNEFNPETGEHVVFAEPTGEPPPDISLIAGDCLFDLRASLDHVVYALSAEYFKQLGKPLPTDVAESTEFPIFGDPDRYLKWAKARKIGHIDP